MRFLTTVFLLMLGVTVYGAEELSQAPALEVEGNDAAAVESRDDGSIASILQKRKCTYNGCKCSSRGYQFHSCGNCYWTDTGEWAITAKRVSTHIFECGPTGSCCDYGPADDCGTSHARCFVRD